MTFWCWCGNYSVCVSKTWYLWHQYIFEVHMIICRCHDLFGASIRVLASTSCDMDGTIVVLRSSKLFGSVIHDFSHHEMSLHVSATFSREWNVTRSIWHNFTSSDNVMWWSRWELFRSKGYGFNGIIYWICLSM